MIFDVFCGGVPFALLLLGFYFGVRLRFFPFVRPRAVAARLFARPRGAAVRATCMALAGTVGVGNIAGVALALSAGGAGAVFWMVVCSFAAMLLKYAEILLSMHAGGGTPAAMRRAGMRRLATLFSFLCIGYTLTVGAAVQANAVADCLSLCFSVRPVYSGLLLLLLTLPVAAGGGRRISRLTALLVPPMCIAYILTVIGVLAVNRAALPGAISAILTGAFSPAAAGGGCLGFLFSRALRVGAARGLMSNEGGCGTSPLAHATAKGEDPVRQGMFGILEVWIDTTVLCTLTALAILSACPSLEEGAGLSLVLSAFSTLLPRYAGPWLSLLLFFFAYATVLCQAFYGQSCVAYLTGSRHAQRFFLLAFCISLFLGACTRLSFVWRVCDILLAAMTYANLYYLFRCRETVVRLTPGMKKTG